MGTNLNMFNFEDPKVLSKFTKTNKSRKKYWRKSYGFKYSYNIPGFMHKKKGDISSCARKCLKMEYSIFSQKCKQTGGVFKCCLVVKWDCRISKLYFFLTYDYTQYGFIRNSVKFPVLDVP